MGLAARIHRFASGLAGSRRRLFPEEPLEASDSGGERDGAVAVCTLRGPDFRHGLSQCSQDHFDAGSIVISSDVLLDGRRLLSDARALTEPRPPPVRIVAFAPGKPFPAVWIFAVVFTGRRMKTDPILVESQSQPIEVDTQSQQSTPPADACEMEEVVEQAAMAGEVEDERGEDDEEETHEEQEEIEDDDDTGARAWRDCDSQCFLLTQAMVSTEVLPLAAVAGTPPETLAEAFRWAHRALGALWDGLSSQQEALATRLRRPLRLATQFSGMGTPERAMEFIVAAASTVLGVAMDVCLVSCCDKEAHCRQTLMGLPLGPNAHVFSNILEKLPLARRRRVERSDANEAAMRDAIVQGPLLTRAICDAHGADCSAQCDADLWVAGSPCVDWSPMGRRRGTGGPSRAVFLTWCHDVREQAPALLLHENVPRFPKRLLEAELGELYEIRELGPDRVVTPQALGFPVRRKRRYLLLVHRQKGSIDDAMLCAASEALFVGSGGLKAADLFVEGDAAPSAPAIKTDRQIENVRLHEESWRTKYHTDPNCDGRCVFDANFRTSEWHFMSNEDGALPTLTTSASKMYCPAQGRCLTRAEKLVAMGYPVHEDLAIAAGVEVMRLPPSLGCCKIDKLIGNAMHLAAVGAAILATLVSWEPATAACSNRRQPIEADGSDEHGILLPPGTGIGTNDGNVTVGSDRSLSAPVEAAISSVEGMATFDSLSRAGTGGDDRGSPPCGQAVPYSSPSVSPCGVSAPDFPGGGSTGVGSIGTTPTPKRPRWSGAPPSSSPPALAAGRASDFIGADEMALSAVGPLAFAAERNATRHACSDSEMAPTEIDSDMDVPSGG